MQAGLELSCPWRWLLLQFRSNLNSGHRLQPTSELKYQILICPVCVWVGGR